jgi:imidazolonepropionase-like amidohydrolase
MIKRTLLAAVAACAMACSAAAQDIAVTGATLATGDGSGPVENGTVIIRGGAVVAAGRDVSVPAGMQVIDGTGKWVTPGIFMPLTDLGLWDVGAVASSNDVRPGDARFNAALDASTAVNYASQHVAVSRAGGVTRATITTAPASSIFAGQGAVIDTGADRNAVMKPRAFQLVVLGEQGGRIAGGSRVAAFAEFANALREASDFAAGRWSGEDNLLTRADAEALGPVLNGTQQLYIHVERAADINAVLGLKRNYPKLDMVLVGVSEGWLVADQIAASGVPVIADAIDNLPSSFEQLGATQSNVGRMVDAGVTVALGGLSGGVTAPRIAPQFAGNLVSLEKLPRASGLNWGEALATITSIPAEIAGYGGRLGVLKPGAVGDLVIWDGDPLEVSSAPVQVFIDGVEQPLDNHQTRLRNRYRDLDESDLPKAYDW